MSDLICVYEPGLGADLKVGTLVRLGAEESHHLCRVRRVGEGREVWVITGEGPAGRCVVEDPDPAGAGLRVHDVAAFWREPSLRVTLAQGLVRPAEMDAIITAASALGVHAIAPLLTERVERRGVRIERWQRLAAESAKQAGRGWVPRILPEAALEDFLRGVEYDRLLVAHPDSPVPLADVKKDLEADGAARLILVVGPEGDLTPKEREALSELGGAEYSLGERRLRSELAALKALALLLD